MTATATQPAAIDLALASLHALRDDLASTLIERNAEIDGFLLATVASEHFLMVGPPGTAKSLLVKLFADALDLPDGGYFEWLMSAFSVPEELFGAISVRGLEADEYRRVTVGKMPIARVAFLDEVFKANPAILNALLTILNERAFDNPLREKVPLQVCVGASNELPQDPSLGALYDRFLVRCWTGYVKDDAKFADLLVMDDASISARLSQDELDTLRAAVSEVDVSGVISSIVDLRGEMIKAGFADANGDCTVSDRRWRKCVKLVRAKAVIEGRDYAVVEDLMVLADVLWDEPEDRAKVAGIIASGISPDYNKALRIKAECVAGYDRVDFDDKSGAFGAAATEAKLKFDTAADELSQMADLPVIRDIETGLATMREKLADALAKRYNLRR